MPNMIDIRHAAEDRTSRRSNVRLILIAAAGLLAAGAYGVHALTAPPAGRGHHRGGAPVEIGTVAVKTLTVAERTIGTVVANSTVNVTSQVAGQVVAAEFQEGQIVRKGAVLFRLDPRPFQAALAQAEANLARDRAQLEAAQRDQSRYETLFSQNAISAQQRDQHTAEAGALAGSVKADEAAVEIARLNLEYAAIRSPVDGKTGPILIQPGNLVKADDTNPLVVVTQIQPIKVSFFLPQTDLPRIQAQLAAHRLEAHINAHGDAAVLSAPVDFVGNAVNNLTGTIELRASFPNGDRRLVPGELVDVSVTLNELKDALTVPSPAVNVGPNGHYVYVVDAKGVAHLVPVEIVYDNGSDMAVTGKLAPGMRVVAVGQLRVQPGEKVTVTGSRGDAAHAAP